MISETLSEKITTAMSNKRKCISLLLQVKKFKIKKCSVRLEKLTLDKLLVYSEKYTPDTCPVRSETLTFEKKYNLKKCFVRVKNLKFNRHKDGKYFSNSKSIDSVAYEKVQGSKRENSENCAGSSKKFKYSEGVKSQSGFIDGSLLEKCNVCLSTFQGKRSLWLHLQDHEEEIPFMCKLCLKVFFDSDSLISHGLQPCKCAMCDKSMSRLMFESHLKTCQVYNPYCCRICVKRFSSSDTFHDHMKGHKESNSSVCKICGEFLLTSSQINRHKERYHPELTNIAELEPFNTPAPSSKALPVSSSKDSANSNKENFCNLNRVDSIANKHLESQKGSRVSSLEEKGRCSVCPSTFKDKRSLWLHAQDHAEETPFRCKSCLKIFSNNDSLISHGVRSCKCAMCGRIVSTFMFESHLNVCEVYNPYCCRICAKRFSGCDTFYSHMNDHKDSNSSVHKICGKFLSQRTRHKEMYHSELTNIAELEPFNVTASSSKALSVSSSEDTGIDNEINSCDISSLCTIVYNEEASHNSSTVDCDTNNEGDSCNLNDAEGNFRCFACQKTFQTKRSLWHHVQDSPDEAPSRCSCCLGIFVDRVSLNTHQLQPCSCAMCGKRLRYFNMWKHLKKCTIYNPYKCRVCSKCFFDRHLLHKHMMRHKLHSSPSVGTSKIALIRATAVPGVSNIDLSKDRKQQSCHSTGGIVNIKVECLCDEESHNIDYVNDGIFDGETKVFPHSGNTKSTFLAHTYAEGGSDSQINLVKLKEEEVRNCVDSSIADPLLLS